MSGNLRVARCARGEEHEHKVVAAGSVFGTQEFFAEERILLVKRVPALPLSIGADFNFKRRRILLRFVNLLADEVLAGADYCGNSGSVEAVGIIVLLKQIACRNGYCAELMKTQNGKPELVSALHDKHDAVALFDAEALEIVGAFCGILFHIKESQIRLFFIL